MPGKYNFQTLVQFEKKISQLRDELAKTQKLLDITELGETKSRMEVERLQEALEFYADERNYLREYSYNSEEIMDSVVDHDKGERARIALAGETID